MASETSPPRLRPLLQRAKSPTKRQRAPDITPKVITINNNNLATLSPREQASSFAEWFRRLMDEDRGCLGLYLADDALVHWFGKTIKSKKKISTFLKYDMQPTCHRFNRVEPSNHIKLRGEEIRHQPTAVVDSEEDLASPLKGVTPTRGINASLGRVSLRSLSCKRNRESSTSPRLRDNKKQRTDTSPMETEASLPTKDSDINNKNVTPPRRMPQRNMAFAIDGRGDSVASTSVVTNNRLSELPRKHLEAVCAIEFNRSPRDRRSEDMKWERPCKLQVAYAEDPVCVGEYVIFAIVYTDNNKCRRNLLAAFEAVGKEEQVK